MQLEQIAVAALRPYERNSRTHSPEQVAQIVASIREFGFTNPVLVDKDNRIIAGHGRVMAATELGLAEVPCLRLENMSDEQVRAYVIADNKLAENAGWDDAMLKLEVDDLQAMDFDLGLLALPEAVPEKNKREKKPRKKVAELRADQVFSVFVVLSAAEYKQWATMRGKRSDREALVAMMEAAQ